MQNLSKEFGRPTTIHTSAARSTIVASTLQPNSSRRPATIVNTVYPEMEQVLVPSQSEGEEEERITGAVSWKVYLDYIRATGSWFWVAVSMFLLCLVQVTNVAMSLFLGWWSADTFGVGQNLYMAIYAGLGLGIAIFTVSIRSSGRSNADYIVVCVILAVCHGDQSILYPVQSRMELGLTSQSRLVGSTSKWTDRIQAVQR